MDFSLQVGIALVALLFFSLVSFRKKWLDFEGVLVGNIVGIAIFLWGSFGYFLLAIFFFIAAEAGTFFPRRGKQKKHETRTTGNILGNSLPAVLSLLLNFPLGFFAGLAAALADTMSSEIGLLSKRKPVLITSLKRVEPGTDGGVTSLGMYAAFFGAALIAVPHYYLFQNAFLALAIVLSGFMGSAIDSFFGATLERKKILGNTGVNFLGSLGGVAVAFLLSMLA